MSNDSLSPQEALIYVMVVTAAADRDMTDRELKRIGDQVRNLPVFADFDESELVPSAEECAARLGAGRRPRPVPGRDRRLAAAEPSWKPPMLWRVKSPQPTCVSRPKRCGSCRCCASGSGWTA